MAKLDVQRVRDLLQTFQLEKLFVEELGWSRAAAPKPKSIIVANLHVSRTQIAELGGVVVFEVTTADGTIPSAKQQAAIHKEISKTHYENVLIFLDKARTQSLWYWVKRDGKKSYPRPHLFVKGQPGDLFLSNIASMVVDLGELDEHGNIAVTEVARRVKDALDVERVTKKFYEDYRTEHVRFVELIEGVDDERDRQWYASVLLNRLMFIYFLQRKFFIDKGDGEYLQRRLETPEAGDDYWYYSTFLKTLFFEGFAKPELKRSSAAKKLLGEIKFLNGGLFLPHKIEEKYGDQIRIKNAAFENILDLFKRYSWNLNDTPGKDDNEIRPDVLGYIFEKYINQKAFGAYYTRTEITEYLCEQTINKLILEKVNGLLTSPGPGARSSRFETIADLLLNLDGFLCRQLLTDILPSLSILDPACGSGAFLVAALNTLINTYSAVIGRIEFLNDNYLNKWLREARRDHPSISYFIKKRIITDNLFGVDIMEEASEIAKLRLFLTLVASAETAAQLEPLPNIDFNLLTGNSLIGLMHVDDKEFDKRHAQGNLFRKGYGELLAETKRKIDLYRKNAAYSESLVDLRDEIDELKKETALTLDEILLAEFQKLGIKFEQATWDEKKNKEGKSIKRPLKLSDITALKPFHWGFEFDDVINHRGGFDVIITNPPWETFEPNVREFFFAEGALDSKKQLDIKDFEKELAHLLTDARVLKDWLDYKARFNYQRIYFRDAGQYANQTPLIDGKRHRGKDINLYKLFLEQAFNLLRPQGLCGIVIPSGVYTDLGAKRLRELLFECSEVTGLFCFENRKEIFEGVHRSFKFVVLSFQKAGKTRRFPAAFMRHDVDELSNFPSDDAVRIDIDLIKKIAPDSLAVMEIKDPLDEQVTRKMARFPLLGEQVDDSWSFEIHREFNMTDDADLFHKVKTKGMLPLIEGKMIHQFSHQFAPPRYWLNEREAADRLLIWRKRSIQNALQIYAVQAEDDAEPLLDYKSYRLAFRDVAASTNERTMIMTLLPPNVFCPHTMSLERVYGIALQDGKPNVNVQLMSNRQRLFLCGVMNSFAVDAWLRRSVTNHVSFFIVYGVPVPRLSEGDSKFDDIVDRVSRLICVTSDFDNLARQLDMSVDESPIQDLHMRRQLRAEIDSLVAHLYGLTEEEFTHILSTFPIVEQSVKDAALDAYREFAPKPGDQEIAALIAKGESNILEFKSSARWDFKQNKQNKAMEDVVVKTVAAMLNTDGGNLLIGVDDNRKVIGLEYDYKLFSKPDKRDAYENFLTTLLLGNFGKGSSALISITIHELEGKDVAKVAAKPSPRPVFVKDDKGEHLYIRAGNSTRLLSTKEALDYCRIRWPN
jgi:schlafen family protein/Eco57I restriction-modification methylase